MLGLVSLKTSQIQWKYPFDWTYWIISVQVKTIHSAVKENISMVSCQKGPTRHAYAWQIGPFWQDTIDMS